MHSGKRATLWKNIHMATSQIQPRSRFRRFRSPTRGDFSAAANDSSTQAHSFKASELSKQLAITARIAARNWHRLRRLPHMPTKTVSNWRLKRCDNAKFLKRMARPKGFEPLTPRFVVWCSIQLSYGRLRSAGSSLNLYQTPCARLV